MNPTMKEKREELEIVIDDFQWAYPNRSENRGEVWVDPDTDELVLEVWTRDNENPDDERVKPLRSVVPIDEFMDARDQVRQIVHMFLAHEADEQMWFGEFRPFYPHELANV